MEKKSCLSQTSKAPNGLPSFPPLRNNHVADKGKCSHAKKNPHYKAQNDLINYVIQGTPIFYSNENVPKIHTLSMNLT